jgi:uncharacterized protein YegP (UPF0339 family)
MPAKFVVYQDKAKRFRFSLLAANNAIIATGEAYENKASCLKGIRSIQKNAPVAVIVDETAPKEPAKKATAKKPEAEKPAVKKAETKKAAAQKQ